ncbi:dynein regulatory complex protein 11 [Anthonomus grandis grandis]|uniref:dynein regulatory complex protein 11 n=1 Tax=Anthonomus grandis grandis TaxID=2921223 RepID=UPI0021667AD3|nr:dynein regulatory complex protein 11 [Anthonomus grandis grandis]
MSHKYYDQEFIQVQNYLSSTLSSEPVQADRREHRPLLATLYLRYIVIANKLANCVDQMVQPQKRILLRKLLEATLGRILELKTDLVEADLTEWTHCGDVLERLNLTPIETELQIPTCFRRERDDEIQYKKRVIEEVLDKLGFTDKVEEKAPMTEQQAILIVQTHERARQGRLRAQFMREIRSMKEKSKPQAAGEEEEEDKGLSINLAAAIKIQKIWRGYLARRATRRRKLQEMLLIGMIPPPKKKNEELERDLQNQERRRKLQKQRQAEYEEEIKRIRSNLEKNQRGPVLEQLSDQVRGWLHEYKAQTGKIPEYTGSERSASRLMLSRQGTESETSKSTPGSSKDSKSKKEKVVKSPKEGKGPDQEEEEGRTKALVSTFVPELNIRKEEYDEIWRSKNESANPRQHPYTDMIEHDQMTEMENELRKIVDEMMRAELMLLQEAFDKDRGHKGKKKSSKKARKTGKKSKKKKEKDLTPDRTTESLFEELVANGIIKKYPEVWLKDFQGERSFNSPAPYNRGKEPPIDLGDIRQVLTEYCIIPLLSDHLHQTTPHIKSVLLAGPKGSGKDMLVHAICNETGAVLFDLTPANIVGKYPGKSGLIMLIHLVVKVSRLLQPSVIYMDNAERPFVKKVPKTDKSDPKRLKKDLPKIVKNFCAEDRVILLGVTDCPWESDQKLLQQVYQKFFLIPRPTYSSRYFLWTHLLSQYMAVSWKFDTSVMSKISDGYTVGSIVSTVKEVITVKRMLQLRIHPLSPLELINDLCTRTPVYKEEDEAFELWWTKVPMVRRRLRAVEMLLEEEADMMAKQANAKKK